MQKGNREQKSAQVLFSVCNAVQFTVCRTLCACQMRCFANSWGKELHLSMLSCEENVTHNFCFVDEQVVMGNKLLVYIR